MTTSGSIAYNPAVTDLVTEAFRDCNIINEDESPTADQYTSAVFRLNGIAAGLQATGIHVWTESEAILFLQPYQARYTIGAPSGNDHTADADSWTQAYTSAAAAAGAGTITVQSATGLVSGANIGIVTAAGSMFWTTINGAPAGTTVTLATVLPGTVNSGALVASYALGGEISRPLKVPAARRLLFATAPTTSQPAAVGNTETDITALSRQEYQILPNKQSPGSPNQFYYSPQVDRGWFYVWQVVSTVTWGVRFTWYRPLQDFFAPNNTMDFPQEWAAPLRYLLTDELKLSYAVPEPRATRIEKKAMEWSTIVSGWDRDSEPIEFGMDFRFR